MSSRSKAIVELVEENEEEELTTQSNTTNTNANSVAAKKKKKKKSNSNAASTIHSMPNGAVDISSLAAALQLAASPINTDSLVLDSLQAKLEQLEPSPQLNHVKANAQEIEIINAKRSEIKNNSSNQSSELVDLYLKEFEDKLVISRYYTELLDRYNRTSNQKNKLQTLSHELQRRVKIIGEESSKLTLAQQSQYNDLRNKFETSLNSIQTQLNQHETERQAVIAENSKLKENIGQLLNYTKLQDQQTEHQSKTKSLELKLAEAKLQQQVEICSMEQSKNAAYMEKITQLSAVETELKRQLHDYADKFSQVQSTLNKSNDLFGTFKGEMEKMVGLTVLNRQFERISFASRFVPIINTPIVKSFVSVQF
jgi:hypothetical protein